MDYYQPMQPFMDQIFEKVKEEFYGDERVVHYLDTYQSLQEVIEEQESLIREYFQKTSQELVEEKACWHFYKDSKLPFVVIHKGLKTLKKEMLKCALHLSLHQESVIALEYDIDRLMNMAAKIYIKKELHRFSQVIKKYQKKRLLFTSHIEWMEKIIKAVKADDSSFFPLQSSKQCTFSQHMLYPEGLMVCMDANLCGYLHDLHILLHKHAHTFYLFYWQKEYVQAYIIFKELAETASKFQQVIAELYYLSYSDPEASLFKLIDLLMYQSQTHLHLTMIDLKGISTLNERYGELAINLIYDEIRGSLQAIVQPYSHQMLLVRGVTSDFYLLSIGMSEDLLRSITQSIHTMTNRIFQVENKEIALSASVVSMGLTRFRGKNRNDLTKMIFRLKKIAKGSHQSYILQNGEMEEDLLRWLESSYQDIDLINKKLNEGMIDLVFQPIFRIETGEVEILEALVRLVCDDGSLVGAHNFIDTIYAIGAIERLDQLVLEKLIHYKQELLMVSRTLFVNVSFVSLLDTNYQKTLKKFLEEMSAFEIIFELTEQKIVENTQQIEALHRQVGAHFAVDDFGSGYSSLKTVSELSKKGLLKVLKIDGTLIQNIAKDIQDQKVVEVIANLSDVLALESVGEFIEDRASFDKLKMCGVTYAQGYYLSRPESLRTLVAKKLSGLLTYRSKEGADGYSDRIRVE